MAGGRTDRSHDAFADTGKDCLLAGAADKLLDVGTHGDAGLGDKLDTVFGNGCHRRRVNDLGVDRCLHSLEHVAAGEVDSRGGLEVKVHVSLVGTDKGVDDTADMAACQIVGLQVVLFQLQTSLAGGNHVAYDDCWRHLTEAHENKLHERHIDTGHECLEPYSHRHKIEEQYECNDTYNDNNNSTHNNVFLIYWFSLKRSSLISTTSMR